MASYNKVILMGNMTRDVEMRAAGGTNVGKFGLAMNRSFSTQSGEKREEVTFVECEAWGKTAEIIAKYLSKGKPIFIEGRLKLDQWDDKEGKKRSAIKVVVEGFQFIDSKGGGSTGGGGDSSGSQGSWNRGAATAPIADVPSDSEPQMANDDIPF